jgi:glycosyltransferase involved in cell wall biosynthesis
VKKPAVLIIVENLPVPLDRRVWQESCALRDAGYEVIVICPKMRGYNLAEEKLEGIQIYRHWISEEAGGFIGFFREYASALFGEFRLAVKAWFRHRFRIIHLCNPPDLLFLVAFPFKLLGVKIIYDVHDVWPEMFEAKFGKRGLFYCVTRAAERLTYATANVVLATNESVRRIAMERGRKSPERVFVVRTAPKIGAVEGAGDVSLKKGKPFLVGYVGVMGDADGLSYLLDAAAYVVHKKGRKDVQFLLMGTGPEFPRLLEQRKRLKLEEFVDMPGRVTNEYLFAALRTIDLGVSCDPINSYNDHCTMNKVLEYMAFGKAQVLFELKEGRQSAAEAAVYVPKTSGEDLGQAIIATIDDEVGRRRMGQIGAERIRNVLNWEKSVQQLLLAYEAALGPRN